MRRTSESWIQHLHGRGRVVDRSGQGLDRDVNDDPYRERGILLDRSLVAERDHPAQLARVRGGAGPAAVNADQRGSGRHEVADAVLEHEQAAALVPPAHEPVEVDRLDRAGCAARHRPRRVLPVRRRRAREHVRRVECGDEPLELPADVPGPEGRHRHGPQLVQVAVEENDEEEEAQEHEHAGDGNP